MMTSEQGENPSGPEWLEKESQRSWDLHFHKEKEEKKREREVLSRLMEYYKQKCTARMY